MTSTNNRPLMALIEPSSKQIARLKRDLPNWRWEETSFERLLDGAAEARRSSIRAILVFARTHEEEHALALCQDIRKQPELEPIPLLVTITIYQMMLGNEVKKLPKAHFLFTPIEEEKLRNRLDEMNEC